MNALAATLAFNIFILSFTFFILFSTFLIDFTDVLHAPLDWRLVEQTRSSLQEASDNLIQLYKRISLDHSLDEGLRHRFLQDLVTSADVGQATLRPLTHQPYVSHTFAHQLKW